jgi:hypothetical protein
METTKNQRRLLRELCAMAWEAEARAMLTRLEADFHRWRAQVLDSGELIEAIHQFHQHDARELWNVYSLNDKRIVAMRAIARGFVRVEDIPEAIRPLLQFQLDALGED